VTFQVSNSKRWWKERKGWLWRRSLCGEYVYRGNLDEKLQRYREKQRMFFAFFFAENVCGMGSEKKSMCAYLLCFLLLRIFDNVVLSKKKTI
jgi:hypothetical protein